VELFVIPLSFVGLYVCFASHFTSMFFYVKLLSLRKKDHTLILS